MINSPEMERLLEEIIDPTRNITPTSLWRRGPNTFFETILNSQLGEPTGTIFPNPGDFWAWATGITRPAGYIALMLYTRKAYRYPYVQGSFQWPDMSRHLTSVIHFGLENGSGIDGGLCTWRLASTDELGIATSRFNYNITPLLPANWNTTWWIWRIEMCRHGAEFKMARPGVAPVLIAVVMDGPAQVHFPGPPYDIIIENYHFPSTHQTWTGFIGIEGGGATDPSLSLGIGLKGYVLIERDYPTPTKRYALYNTGTNTLWAGQVIAAGTITSHPVPVQGTSVKSLYFQTAGAGTLVIQSYIEGDWRNLETIAVAANTLVVRAIDLELDLIRATFTPDGFPTTVTLAEVRTA